MINAFSLHISQRDEIQLKRGHLSRNRVHDQQIKMKQIVRKAVLNAGKGFSQI